MRAVKTAISIQQTLFAEMDALSKQAGISRSQLFSKAAEEFLQRHQDQYLTDQVNQACQIAESDDEFQVRKAAAGAFAKLVKGTW